MKGFNPSLAHKVLIAIIMILSPILLSSIYGYNKNKESIKDHVKKDLTALAEAYEGQLYEFLEMSKRRVQDFSSDGVIKDNLRKIITGDKQAVYSLNDYILRNKKPIDKTISRIHIISSDGRVVAATDISSRGMDVSEEEYFIKGKDGLHIIEDKEGFSDFAVSAPIIDEYKRETIGVFVNFIMFSDLNSLLSGESNRALGALSSDKGRRKTMEVYLVNKDRLMITESKFIEDAVLMQQVDTTPVRECLNDNREFSGFYNNYRGMNVGGASMCFPEMMWTLLVEVDEGEILMPAMEIRRNVIIGSAIVVCLIGTFFLFFYRCVIRPLKKISKTAELIASGEYGVTISGLPCCGMDNEIGRLSSAFNYMARNIKSHIMLLKDSEAKLKAIIDNSPAVICMKDMGGKYLLVNQRFEDLFKNSKEQISGKSDFDIFPAEVASEFRANDLKVLESRSPLEFDEIVPQEDGIHHYISIKFPIFDSSGALFAVGGISTDVTDRIKVENENHALQKRYEYLINNLNIGIFRFTPDGQIIEANKAALELSGADSKEELIRFKASDFCQDKERYKRLIDKILKYGFIKKEEIELLTLKGSKIQASVSGILRKEASGTIYIDGFIDDITEQKSLEEQLRQAQKMESIGQLAGGIAHDFNNILTTIIGYANLLEMKRPDDGLVKVYTEIILSACDRATNLTHGLLAFSRKQIMSPRPTDLNGLIKNFGKIMERIIGEDIELGISLSNKDLVVNVDPLQIEQVLMNLTTNARDAMPAGGALTISTGLVEVDNKINMKCINDPTGKYALISFADTGAGMDKETQRRIFEPFFTTKEVGKGTGLGLSMVHGIINQHKGYIEVESKPGKGTIFRIYLPLTEEEAEKRGYPGAVMAKGGNEAILLAEDEEDVRMLTGTILKEFGYRVIESKDGEDAIRKFIENLRNIHLCIFDIVMPRKGGVDAYEAIKKVRPDIKVLFTSGYAPSLIEKKWTIPSGAYYIPKPVSPVEFLRKIREVLDREPVIIVGKPPALPGDSQSLTFTGMYESLRTVNRSKFAGKEAFSGRQAEFIPYGMGLQVSHCLDTEMQEEGIVW